MCNKHSLNWEQMRLQELRRPAQSYKMEQDGRRNSSSHQRLDLQG
jgi:hypothetical protein